MSGLRQTYVGTIVFLLGLNLALSPLEDDPSKLYPRIIGYGSASLGFALVLLALTAALLGGRVERRALEKGPEGGDVALTVASSLAAIGLLAAFAILSTATEVRDAGFGSSYTVTLRPGAAYVAWVAILFGAAEGVRSVLRLRELRLKRAMAARAAAVDEAPSSSAAP